MDAVASLALSHVELCVTDLERMEDFYTRVLGFVVTDRGGGGGGEMVFLSRNPGEHHQIVLAASSDERPESSPVDHLAFRATDLAEVRRLHAALSDQPEAAAQTVSHGTSWSLYFRDPEGNRIEVFADTPWHVDQPVRFPVDLGLADDELERVTEAEIRERPGFRPAAGWFAELAARLSPGPGD